jgi:SAM-dependent methyltransferase
MARSSLAALRELLDQVPDADLRRSPDDGMFVGDEQGYHNGGVSALRAIRLGLLAADKPDPASILDLPCGYGRVMRFLRAAFPDAEIVACDLDRGGVDFCAERFGAIPVYSEEDPTRLALPTRFDLAWCGSLLTHLPRERWGPWFATFEASLTRGGLYVFSVHGRLVEHYLRQGVTYSLDPGAVPALLDEFERDGFGYADYPDRRGYGISLVRPDWVVAELAAHSTIKIVSYAEMALNGHQDVVVCEKL